MSDARTRSDRFGEWIQRIGQRIPDPVVLFFGLLVLIVAASVLLSGHRFETQGAGGVAVAQVIKSMVATEHLRWWFDNALLANWLAFGNGVLAVILIVLLAVGIAEHAGLLAALIKLAGRAIPGAWLPTLMVFLGIMSSLATDAGYLILIPLAGLLYAALGKHPLIGMAAAYAGVSAGFSANLIPGTPVDVIIGMNAKAFAEAQQIPFVGRDGQPLQPATMNYYFMLASTLWLCALGTWVTQRFVAPRLAGLDYQRPDPSAFADFALSAAEWRGLRWAALAALLALGVIALLALGPLAAYEDPQGRRVVPYLNNIILLISLFFASCGIGYGIAAGRYTRLQDVIDAMVKQMNSTGYILVLTFVSYNALAVLSYSGLGAYITYLGAQGLLALRLDQFPIPLLVGFVLTSATINLVVAGLTSKWMLLGPIFVPMLYAVNPNMTPDVVAAAYRVADSSTNVITPMMMYAGIVLAFMRKYWPEMTLGDLILLMLPYSIVFLLGWTGLLVLWYVAGLPFGF